MKPIDVNFENRVQSSFKLQRVMATIGASLSKIAPGEVEITLPFRDDLTQHNNFLHAGVISIILDSACGYAAYTLIPSQADMLTVEFKINLIRPAAGKIFIAKGRVIKPGKTLTVCQGEVVGDDGKPIAVMTSTLMTMLGDRK